MTYRFNFSSLTDVSVVLATSIFRVDPSWTTQTPKDGGSKLHDNAGYLFAGRQVSYPTFIVTTVT